MLKIVLLLVYIWAGEVKVMQQPMPDMDTCIAEGNQIVAEMVKDPRFDAGLFADCVPLVVAEANGNSK